jgi:hypothetical protein
MHYIIRKLELYADIVCNSFKDNGNGILYICTGSVSRRNLNPSREDCLSDGQVVRNETGNLILPKGSYLFVQGYLESGLPFSPDGKPAEELYKAAMDLWLEFIWQEIEYADNLIYVRILQPEKVEQTGKQNLSTSIIFQLYRRTTPPLTT